MAAPLRWPAEALWEAVAPQWPGFTVEILPEIDSTNSELMRRARAGQADPVLLVAESQTAGRGRRGRGWVSSIGDSLTFSLGLPLAPAEWSGLSLAVGVAVAEALDPGIGLKWPNDLWISGRKLAGILVETASIVATGAPPAGGPPRRQAVIGIGINLLPRPPLEGADIAPACLRELWSQADAPGALARVVPPLVRAVQAFEREGFKPFAAGFDARDVLRGQEVTLSDGTRGTAGGVNGSGALLVHTAAGLQLVSSSEVSVRPAS
ncbi:MAG: putative bifunctional protein (BirA) : transcriptional regulator (Biotin operon repressor), BirA [Pseudomonadota bacterium]